MIVLLLATRNPHKTREFAQLLGPGFELRDLTEMQDVPEIAETGASFVENARIKAVTVSRSFTEELVIADDSGLEVDALGGAPGIFSARYAGENATDEQNVEKLLRELGPARGRAGSNAARFRCVIALAQSGGFLGTFDGAVDGAIAPEPRGNRGFGYDPVFVPEGFTATFAELPADLKNQISHRARATTKLRQFLQKLSPNDP
jgi:XTP/dITP diphosphohydrolase